MEAAFVEIGLEKNGFLYVDEIVGPELEGRKGARKIQDLIQRGQNVLVQAVKDPMKTKGARLTTEISLPGRFVVFVPHGDGLGVSRRLEDEERNRLKAILKEIAPKKGGVIVRTAAEGASAEDIERDLDFLQRLWKTIEAQAKDAKAPSLIYQEAELPLRVTRDLFTGDFERLLVDHDRTHKRIVGYLKKTSPHMVERVTRYKEREPLMEAFGVEQEIKSTLNRRVDLPSGGYLIFDYAEAFTVIDVNTGRFVGSRSKKSGARLEDTITKNNLEAVKEVVRQLRLRDIGGIIVIDFIDMASPKNRAAGRGGARRGARARPHEDLRRRDLTARPRRDDAPERHRRPARGDDEEVPDLRRRRHRRLRAHGCGRRRAQAARARHARLALEGVQGRGQREGRRADRRPRRLAAAGARGDDQAPLLPRRQGRRAPRPLHGARAGARSRRSRPSRRSRSARRSSSSSARSACTTRTPASARSRASTSSSAAPRSSSARRSRCGSPRSPRGWRGPSCSSPVEPTLEPLTAEGEAERPTRAKRTTTRKKDEAAVGDADETVEDDAEEVEVDDEAELDDETELEDEAFEAAEAEPARGRRRSGNAEEAHAPRHPRRPQPQEEAGDGRR